MRVSIVGGGGRVGSNFAFALLLSRLAREIHIIDIVKETMEGEALDLRHSLSMTGTTTIKTGWLELVKESDMVVITAGARRKPDESRLELLKRNVTILDSTVEEIVKLNRDCFLFIVANPVDVLTYRAYTKSGFPPNRVFGLGNTLDMVRFRSLLGEKLGLDPTQIQAFMLGEHGDSMVPLWSKVSVCGQPLRSLTGISKEDLDSVFAETRKGGAEVIRLKGGAGWAVAVAINRVVEAIVKDTKEILPIGVVAQGQYGISDVALSLPTIVGKTGVEKIVEFNLTEDELRGLRESAKILKDSYSQIA